MTTKINDLVDVYIAGCVYEVTRELNSSDEILTPAFIGEAVEKNVLATLEHECQLQELSLLDYMERNTVLRTWYETNISRYSDHFLEIIPQTTPYTQDPEKYANMWSNLATQMIGAVYGNIREDGV